MALLDDHVWYGGDVQCVLVDKVDNRQRLKLLRGATHSQLNVLRAYWVRLHIAILRKAVRAQHVHFELALTSAKVRGEGLRHDDPAPSNVVMKVNFKRGSATTFLHVRHGAVDAAFQASVDFGRRDGNKEEWGLLGIANLVRGTVDAGGAGQLHSSSCGALRYVTQVFSPAGYERSCIKADPSCGQTDKLGLN